MSPFFLVGPIRLLSSLLNLSLYTVLAYSTSPLWSPCLSSGSVNLVVNPTRSTTFLLLRTRDLGSLRGLVREGGESDDEDKGRRGQTYP